MSFDATFLLIGPGLRYLADSDTRAVADSGQRLSLSAQPTFLGSSFSIKDFLSPTKPLYHIRERVPVKNVEAADLITVKTSFASKFYVVKGKVE
jgi:hypothetical protein